MLQDQKAVPANPSSTDQLVVANSAEAVVPVNAANALQPAVHPSPISQLPSSNQGSGQVVAQGNDVNAKVQVNPNINPRVQLTSTVGIFNSKAESKIGDGNTMKDVTITNAPSCNIL